MPEDIYRKSWSRQNRGLLIFLLDQSGSMQQQLEIDNQTYTNGQMATAALNNLIVSVIHNTPPDADRGGLKDYCDVLVLGYGDAVTGLLADSKGMPISIRNLAANPKGRKSVLVQRFDRLQQKIIQVKEEQPYWIDYTADSRYTEMAKALQRAYRVIQDWLAADANRHKSFPPIVINITDGEHNGEGDPIAMANYVRNMHTDDGHVLLFSCHLTSNGLQRLVFPKVVDEIDAQIQDIDERESARQLFHMSSIIPATMVRKARSSFNAGLQEGARGFIYNASPSDLIDFLRWGTQPSDNLRRSVFV